MFYKSTGDVEKLAVKIILFFSIFFSKNCLSFGMLSKQKYLPPSRLSLESQPGFEPRNSGPGNPEDTVALNRHHQE